MNRLDSIAQTYIRAPWRKQLQLLGMFFLILVSIALVTSIYLKVSADATSVGRSIQTMQKEIEEIDREIEDLQSRLALITSSEEMESRAIKLGFEPVSVDQIIYLKVPGYVSKQTASMSTNSRRAVVSAPVLPREYTESLFEWFRRQVLQSPWFLAEIRS